MITWIAIAVTAYLLVGCIIALIAQRLLDGALTRKEFLTGMAMWPIGFAAFVWFFVRTVWKHG